MKIPFLAKSCVIIFLLLKTSISYSQNVGINSSGSSPDASAGLDVNFTNKGVLIPRVALTGKTDNTTIASAATSLLVYNTANAGTSPNEVFPGYYWWDGVTWNRFANEILRKFLTANVVNNNPILNSIADVSGLSFDVIAGETYKFKFYIIYNAQATSTGSRWSISGPTASFLRYSSEYTLTATTTTKNVNLSAYDNPAASNATSIASGNIAIIEGFITPSSDGTVIARFASEVANSSITAVTGISHVEYTIIK